MMFMLIDLDNMDIEKLKDCYSGYVEEKIPEHNRIDFDKDDLNVIRSKLKAIIDEYIYDERDIHIGNNK